MREVENVAFVGMYVLLSLSAPRRSAPRCRPPQSGPTQTASPDEISLSASLLPRRPSARPGPQASAPRRRTKIGSVVPIGQIRAHRKRQRANAQQLHGDHQEHAQQHQPPGQLAAQDAVDHRGHQPRLRRGGCAADALNPVHLNASRRRRVEIFAVLQLGRADGIQHDVFGLVVRASSSCRRRSPRICRAGASRRSEWRRRGARR